MILFFTYIGNLCMYFSIRNASGSLSYEVLFALGIGKIEVRGQMCWKL